MKPVKLFFLVLACILFLAAFGMHMLSFMEPANLLPSGGLAPGISHLDLVIIVSGVMLLGSIITWLGGVILTDLKERQAKPMDMGGGFLEGAVILFRLVMRIPFWLNLVFLGFLVYLIATSLFIHTGADEICSRLKIFGAVCSALNLHAIILLGVPPRRESTEAGEQA